MAIIVPIPKINNLSYLSLNFPTIGIIIIENIPVKKKIIAT